MLTIRDAARLLAAALHGAPLAALTDALGFGTPRPLHPRDLPRLGVTDAPRAAAVTAGPGALRALLLEWDAGPPTPDRVPAIARAIARQGPQHHWLLVARHAVRGELLVAAPAAAARGALPALVVAASIRESDAETFAALAAAGGASDPAALVHLRWREALGRDALTRRFYRDLERAVARLAETAVGRADARDRRSIALLTASRLLFLAFLETKGWLDRDRAFLRHQMERVATQGALHRHLLEPLCFGTLNTPWPGRARAARAFGRVPFLNGGLFQRAVVETRLRALRLDDDAIAAVIGELLPRYRLTARESSVELADAAVDPEMLGRAFESLMAGDVRRARGAFYTPQPLIAHLTGNALGVALEARGPDALRILDPACGSGAFLVHALEAIAALRTARGDARPVSAVRREVLTRSIFGVDVDPTAVWLCQLRLWLSVVVEDERDDPMRLPPLPNLDRNIREGDALAGRGFEDARLPDGAALATLRLRYTRASGARKRTLGRALDAAERARAIDACTRRIAALGARRRELLLAARTRDLFASRRTPTSTDRRRLLELRAELREARAAARRLRDGGALPFSFATHFPEVAAAGGFDLVVGNPPWVRPHALPAGERESLRARFRVLRHAAWEAGAAAAGAGRGFASQADLAAPFVERSVALTRPGGAIALLVPSKLWSALAGGGVRDLFARDAALRALDDWPGTSAGFDAAVYPSALLARRVAPSDADDVQCVLHDAGTTRRWRTPRGALAIEESRGAPWLLLPPEVRAAFDALARAGVSLAASALGRPMLGVKSGCNAAFVVERGDSADGLTSVRSDGRCGAVEASMLRPVLRGEHLRAWAASATADRSALLWTHDERGAARDRLPAATARWLAQWRHELERRSDGGGARWWTLFRTEAARADRARVVWGDIGRVPRALVLRPGDPTVPLNTCYVLRTPTIDDAHALAALLNAPPVAAWLNAIAEPARGGYRRYLGWTCARLPLPRDWSTRRGPLAALGRAGAAGEIPSPEALTRAVVEAYALDARALQPLLDWDAARRGLVR